MKELEGKIGVITGATSGIGLAVSKLLLKHGAKLILIGRSFAKLKEEFNELDLKPNYELLEADFNKGDFIDIIDQKIKRQGPIDFLIHSAGFISLGTMESGKVEDLDLHYKINVRAPYKITRYFLPDLRNSNGQVFFLNSTAGLHAWAEIGQYSSSKYALRSLADSLRQEVFEDGIRVTSIFLGSADTPMQEKVQLSRGHVYEKEKYMKPEDISKLILYLIKLPYSMAVTDLTVRPIR